ncbi:MAG: ComEC/Rec2 family competence protein [Anaerolineales bacterium]|jgi:competence protein ComEC
MTLVWLGAAWLVGIAVGKLCALGAVWWLVPGAFALVAAILLRRRPPLRLLFASLLIFCLGAARLRTSLPTLGPDHIATHNDSRRSLSITGIVVAPPDVRDRYVGLRVEVDSLRFRGSRVERSADGLVLVYAQRFGDWQYGDQVRASGYLETPPVFDTFSYRDYLARKGIYSVMPSAVVARLDAKQGNPILQRIYQFRLQAQETIYRIFPDPEASLLAGILLGIETGIPPELRQDFNDTGTSHIIAISGFNITIIAALLVSLFGRLLGARWGAIVSLTGIGLYTILVGADASVVRAAVMAGLVMLAHRIGRQTLSLPSLAAAAILMTGINPQALWDASFTLSFAATLGLVVYGPPLEAWFVRFAGRWLKKDLAEKLGGPVSEFVLFTLAAQLMTLPLTMYYFRRLSLISLLANPIILPAQPAVMVLGGLATLAGMAWLPLGKALAWIAWPFVAFTIRVVEFFATLPFDAIPLGQVALPTLAGFYLLLAIITLWKRLAPEHRPQLPKLPVSAGFGLTMLAMLSGLAWRAFLERPDGRLHITVLDVGDGDAVLIETPKGRFTLIDGGSSPIALSEGLGRRLPIFGRRLDWVVIGATGEGQVGGLAGVAERFPIGGVLLAGNPGKRAYRSLIQELNAAQIPIVTAQPSHTLDLGEDLRLEVVAMGEHGAVLLLSYQGLRMILAPGADPDLIQELVGDNTIGPVTALLLPDGGYAAVNPSNWLTLMHPRLALISVQAGNQRGLPSWQVLQDLRGISTLRTDLHGWIELICDGQRLWVQVEHQAATHPTQPP